MLLVGERMLAQPHHALGPHVRDGGGGERVHQQRHGVAADAGQRAAALRQARGAVVRATGAEAGHAHRRRRCLGSGQRHARRGRLGRRLRQIEHPGQHRCDHGRVGLAGIGDGRGCALRVEGMPAKLLADDGGLVRRAVEHRAHLLLEHRPLFLDDHQRVQSLCKLAHDLGIERPGHADLEHLEPQRARAGVVDAQPHQRLQHILVGLAGGHDAHACACPAHGDAVEPIDPRVGQRGMQLVVIEAVFLRNAHVDCATVEAASRHREILGQLDLGGIRRDPDRAAAFDDVGDHLHADPAAREARQRDAVQAEVQQLLGVRRIEHRHADRDEHLVGEVGHGGGLHAVVVAGQGHHAAQRLRAGHVGMPQCVAGPVDAGALAVPDAEYAIDLGARKQTHVLRAPDGGGGQVFVQARAEHHLVFFQALAGSPELHIVAAQRRAAIPGDVAAGVMTGGDVALTLLHGQAHQRLDAGHVEPALAGRVLVVQRLCAAVDLAWGSHGSPLCSAPVRMPGEAVARRLRPCPSSLQYTRDGADAQ